VEFEEVVVRRKMTRSFSSEPLDLETIENLVYLAERSPTAGNTRGVTWLLLNGPEETRVYWEHSTTEKWRESSPRWPGLSRVPAILICLVSPAAYVQRYGETDKASSGLGPPPGGGGEAAWPIPYWFSDAGAATMAVLLTATNENLGACFLGNFRGERALLKDLAIPCEWRVFGAVLIGHADGADRRSTSLKRPRTAMIRTVEVGKVIGKV
jgi:nitroreductase